MPDRAAALEAVTIILDTSCAADGCRSTASLAETIVDVLAGLDRGMDVRSAVMAHWEIDADEIEEQRRALVAAREEDDDG